MKLFNFFIILQSIIFANLNVSKANAALNDSKLNEIYIAPLANKNVTKILLNFTASRKSAASFEISIINDYYPKGKQIFSKSFYAKGKQVVEYDNVYTRNENTIKIHYTTKVDGESTVSHSVSSFSVKKVDLFDDNKILDSSACVSYTPEKGWKNVRTIYTLNGFEELYIPNFYHKIDFNDFYISMSENNFLIFDTKVSLLIKDYSSSYIQPDSNGYILMPMKVEKRDSKYYLKPNIDLYVNKDTLEMSFEPNDGCVKTNHFYLPRNEFKQQSNYSFQFSFTEFGNCKSRFTFNFKFNALNNTIGDCINSEYCITKTK